MNKPIKIIIIDDNTVAVESIRKHFAYSEEIKVLATFNNGEEALQYLINHPCEIDLAVLELLLPRLDGVSLLDEINNRNLKIKSIVTSSYKDNHVITNSEKVSKKIQRKYETLEQKDLVKIDDKNIDIVNIKKPFLKIENDVIRHDSIKLGLEIMNILIK